VAPSPSLGEAPADERAQPMAAAGRVLERSGWWGFKVESVLKEAQLSTRSFYRHFQGKDDLVAGLLEETLLNIADSVTGYVDQAQSPPDQVRAYVDSLINWAFDPDFEKPAVMYAGNWRELVTVYPELMTRCVEAFTAPLVSALQQGVKDGTLTSSVPITEAKAVFVLISGAMFDIPRGEANPRKEIEDLVVPFVSRAFGIAPAST
jgi:AcrR family transcriptional regulator